MEWDLKMPPWDAAELEREADPSVGPVVAVTPGAGDSMALPANKVDCSVDLKLGGLGDLGQVHSRWEDLPRPQQQQPPSSTSVMASSGTLKRPRAPSSSRSAMCSVDGCDADLSKCREYHRRHKVCEVHSKTPSVMIGGREQRFCQQCSRFHLLIEFDEVKRSCRKRLDGHNRRRRKPQLNSLNSGNLFPSHQGSMLSVSPQLFPISIPEQSWARVSKSEDIHYRQTSSPQFTERGLCFANSYICNQEGKQFPFLQNNRSMIETSCQIPLTAINLSESKSNGSSGMFSHGVAPFLQSDCARSLLSSPTQTSGINISHIVTPGPDDRFPMGQPLFSNSQYADGVAHRSPSATGSLCPVMEDGAVFVSDDNASSDGTLQMLPFSWN